MKVHSEASPLHTHRVADGPAVAWRGLAAIVQDVLAGRDVTELDRDAATLAVAYGLVERGEQLKPCPTCGTERVDFLFWRVTPAGRLLAEALSEASTPPNAAPGGDEGASRRSAQ